MGKVITCADCKYHICGNTCSANRWCDGYCKMKGANKKCYGARCKRYELDNYFSLKENKK